MGDSSVTVVAARAGNWGRGTGWALNHTARIGVQGREECRHTTDGRAYTDPVWDAANTALYDGLPDDLTECDRVLNARLAGYRNMCINEGF